MSDYSAWMLSSFILHLHMKLAWYITNQRTPSGVWSLKLHIGDLITYLFTYMWLHLGLIVSCDRYLKKLLPLELTNLDIVNVSFESIKANYVNNKWGLQNWYWGEIGLWKTFLGFESYSRCFLWENDYFCLDFLLRIFKNFLQSKIFLSFLFCVILKDFLLIILLISRLVFFSFLLKCF